MMTHCPPTGHTPLVHIVRAAERLVASRQRLQEQTSLPAVLCATCSWCDSRGPPAVSPANPRLQPCKTGLSHTAVLSTQDGSSIGFVDELEKDLKAACAAGCDAKIASGGGRMGVTMDRYEVGNCPMFDE
jgi:hypothetical protein